MYNTKTKIILFHCGCLVARVGLVLLFYFFDYAALSSICFLISGGFLSVSKLPEIGVCKCMFNGEARIKREEGAFGSRVYWPRKVHAFFYMLTGVLLIVRVTRAYAFWGLVGDIVVGYTVFVYHYLPKEGNEYPIEMLDKNRRMFGQHQAILFALIGLYVYSLSTSITNNFYESRGWFLGAYSGLTVVYSVQPKYKYEQLFVQLIGTLCMLVDVRVVYAYVGYAVLITGYVGMEVIKYRWG